MTLIEIETSFGTIAASEQALVDAICDLLVLEGAHRAEPDDPSEAPRW